MLKPLGNWHLSEKSSQATPPCNRLFFRYFEVFVQALTSEQDNKNMTPHRDQSRRRKTFGKK